METWYSNRKTLYFLPSLVKAQKKRKIHFKWEKQSSEWHWTICHHTQTFQGQLSPGLDCGHMGLWPEALDLLELLPFAAGAGGRRDIGVCFFSQRWRTEGWAVCFTSSASSGSLLQQHSSTIHFCGCNPYSHTSLHTLFCYLTTYKVPGNFCYLVFHFRLLVRMAEKLLDLLFQFPYVVAGINC